MALNFFTMDFYKGITIESRKLEVLGTRGFEELKVQIYRESDTTICNPQK